MFPYDDERDKRPKKPDFDGFEEAMKEFKKALREIHDEDQSYSYGFRIVSVDGEPVKKEFYGQPHKTQGSDSSGEESKREPLVDVFPGEEETRVLIDLPGVKEQDIDLSKKKGKLVVDVDSGDRSFHKEIDLEEDSGELSSRYNNGVLEVKVEKEAKEE